MLTAVDAVVMVIDAAKGIEAQTRKLFEVCRRRGVPIFTFMNKCDRPMRDPLALLDELESVLGIGAFPVNWPLGSGSSFRGVYDRQERSVHLFERTPQGAYRAPVQVGSLADVAVREKLDDSDYHRAVEELEMLDIAGVEYSAEKVHHGTQTPVFFGSAMNNFGVQLLLDAFLERSLPPQPRHGKTSTTSSGPELDDDVVPLDAPFSGFVFKIQANMDPRHRDRIAFVRICSGKFTRDMNVLHTRTGKRVRLASAHRLFGQERETVDEAYAGDVIGLVGHAEFGIGDTLTAEPGWNTRNPPLSARVLRLPAQSHSGEVQTIPPGRRTTLAGRGRPGFRTSRLRPKDPAPRRRWSAAIRSRPIPPPERIRRPIHFGKRELGSLPLAARAASSPKAPSSPRAAASPTMPPALRRSLPQRLDAQILLQASSNAGMELLELPPKVLTT